MEESRGRLRVRVDTERGPAVVFGRVSDAGAHRIQINVCGRESHVRFGHDGFGVVALFEKLSGRLRTSIPNLRVAMSESLEELA